MAASDLVFLHSNCYPECVATVDKHFDGYWTLQFGQSGGVEVWYDGARHRLQGSGAWFWPAFPGPRIRFHAAPGCAHWHHRYAAFEGPRVARWAADGLWPTGPQPAPPGGEYPRRFDDLLTLIRAGDRWSQARAVNVLEAFLLELAAARETPAAVTHGTDLLVEVDALIDAGEDAEPDYAALARALGVSLSTLRRRFREATGVPLHAYVVRRRVARARALLGETDLPIKVIADRLGYRDVYFFTRQFRLLVGVPPAAYRRSRQA